MIENTDYELVPAANNEQAWNVRFLTGDYIETVVSIGTLTVNEEPMDDTDDHSLSFNFSLIYSPDDTLTSDDEDLQDAVGSVILHIIEKSIARDQGSVLTSGE
tara:strand:- start:281 stop:589 length:309 start_codon:yes stop_codon:yes gene_type:complete